MPSAYVIVLDGYTFLPGEQPFFGPLVEFSLQRWSEQDVIGDTNPGTVMTFLGFSSPEWPLVSRASAATKDKLVAVHNGRKPVLLKTPQNTTGFNVLLRLTRVEHERPIAGGKYLCEFTLKRR